METQSHRRVSGDLPEFPCQEIGWNYGVLCSEQFIIIIMRMFIIIILSLLKQKDPEYLRRWDASDIKFISCSILFLGLFMFLLQLMVVRQYRGI